MDYEKIKEVLDVNSVQSSIKMYYDLSYEISTYIFDYRIKNKLSQSGLAKILGVTQSMVSKLESGDYNISLENLCNVMAKLDTKISLKISTSERYKDVNGTSVPQHEVNHEIRSYSLVGDEVKDLVLAS